MEFFRIGSVRQYVKGLARRTQWQMKKQSGNFRGHSSLSGMLSCTQPEEGDRKLSSILTKAQAGKKLSPEEWKYLQDKDPALYEKIRAAEREQKQYEEALKRCKTRDEAQRLHVSKLGEVLEAAKAGDSGALVRLNRLTQTMTEFTDSETYHQLPTEAEQAVERARQEAALQDAEWALRAENGALEDRQEDAETVPEEPKAANVEAQTDRRTATGTDDASADWLGEAPEIADADIRDTVVSGIPFGPYQRQQSAGVPRRRKVIDAEA